MAQQKQQLASVAGKMSFAANGKILDCMMNEPTQGMATVLFSRQAADGQIAVAVFLLDLYCLGVKDTIADYWAPTRYNEFREKLVSEQGLERISPGMACGVVEAAVEYADSFGIAPHADYRKMVAIWGDVVPEPIDGRVEFGRDGKPIYVAGPHDSPMKQRSILQKLEASAGEGN